MNTNHRWKKPLYIAAAAGVIGFAAYGVHHTIDAAQASGQDTSVSVDTVNYDPSTGGCGPYGCAACSVCTVLQYQPDIETTPVPQLQQIY
jgi:hypothetical protein